MGLKKVKVIGKTVISKFRRNKKKSSQGQESKQPSSIELGVLPYSTPEVAPAGAQTSSPCEMSRDENPRFTQQSLANDIAFLSEKARAGGLSKNEWRTLQREDREFRALEKARSVRLKNRRNIRRSLRTGRM